MKRAVLKRISSRRMEWSKKSIAINSELWARLNGGDRDSYPQSTPKQRQSCTLSTVFASGRRRPLWVRSASARTNWPRSTASGCSSLIRWLKKKVLLTTVRNTGNLLECYSWNSLILSGQPKTCRVEALAALKTTSPEIFNLYDLENSKTVDVRCYCCCCCLRLPFQFSRAAHSGKVDSVVGNEDAAIGKLLCEATKANVSMLIKGWRIRSENR